jgi:hypothetical protein
MMKKKLIVLSIIMSVVIFLAVFSFNVFNAGHKDSDVAIVKIDTKDKSSKVADASYNDYSDSLKVLKKASDAIVVGKLISYNSLQLGVVSEVAVSNTLKGEKIDKIKIYQMGKVNDDGTISGDVLELGKEYILFLGKQEDDQKDTFYVKGGMQGAFLNDGGKLNNKDNTMKEEINKLIKNNKSESESLLDFINN